MPLYKYFNLINFFIFYLSSQSITLFYHPSLIYYISYPFSLLFSITTMIIIIIVSFMPILIHYPIKYIIHCLLIIQYYPITNTPF
jgi:hypothetical protein